MGNKSAPATAFDPFAASFKINVHQDNIGLIAHGLHKGFLSICHQMARVEA